MFKVGLFGSRPDGRSPQRQGDQFKVSADIPVFVISLVGAARRDAMTRQLARWDGTWSFVDAVDGRTMTPADIDKQCNQDRATRRVGRPLSPSEIGTALSHASIYRRMIDENIDRAIILEDDAVLNDTFFAFPFDAVDWPFDVVSFFTDHSIAERKPFAEVSGVRFHRPVWRASCAAAYMVSLAGARKMAAATVRIQTVADWPVSPVKMDFFVAQPFLVKHTREGSTIERDRGLLRAQYPRHGRMPRFLHRHFNGLATALFIRYAYNHDRYDGIGHYIYREIRPSFLRRFPSRYLFLRGSAGAEKAAPPNA
jgi:glycosyl transferase family 25